MTAPAFLELAFVPLLRQISHQEQQCQKRSRLRDDGFANNERKQHASQNNHHLDLQRVLEMISQSNR